MMRIALIVSAFLSLFLFPFSFSVAMAIAAAVVAPLTPLALGIFADLLYFAPRASIVPLYTCLGALLALGAFGARKFFETSIVSPR